MAVHGAAAGLLASVKMTADAVVSAPEATVERRLELLSARVELLEKRDREREAYLNDVWRILGQKVTDLDSAILAEAANRKEAESRAIEADGRALPVIGLGVLLTGLAELIGRLPFWPWLLVMAVAVACTLVVFLLVRRKRGEDATRPS